MDNDTSLQALEDEIFDKVKRLTSRANLLEQTAKNQEKTYNSYQQQSTTNQDPEYKDKSISLANLMVQNLTEALSAATEINELMTSIKLPAKVYLDNIERMTSLLKNAEDL